jgi:Ca2+-binding EF-hand superfamily protein
MSEVEGGKNLLGILGGISLIAGFGLIGLSPGLGFTCCLFGIFGLVASAITSSAAAFNNPDGKMVLQQGGDGEWNWVKSASESNQQVVQGGAAQYNEQSTQILSRVVSEVRGGTKLEDLEDTELEILASAYGINGGSKQQKIVALNNSELASKALKLSAIAAAGGLGVVGGARIVQSARERAIERAEEIREQGKAKLQENIEKGRDEINSKIPPNEAGESAEDRMQNAVLQQMAQKIKEMDLTPERFIELADLDKDQKLDASEIVVALSTIMGISVPGFIVVNALKGMDKDGDGKLDSSELHQLWQHLGIEIEKEEEVDEFEEINSMLEETVLDEVVEESEEEVEESQEIVPVTNEEPDVVQEEIEETPVDESPQPEVTEDLEVDMSIKNAANSELTSGIDTDFEELIIEAEEMRLSSERRKMIAKQDSQYLVNIRITKIERTLIGDPTYRGGQSVYGLLDGGPYSGIVKIPVMYNEQILEFEEGDEMNLWVKLVDFSASLKRPVLEASSLD